MNDSIEVLISTNGQENEILEQRIKKVTKELQSHYINEGGRGASTDAASTGKPLPSTKIYDESTLQYFEAISKLTEEQGEQLSILTEQARRLVAENEELRRKSDGFGRIRHERKYDNACFGSRSEAMNTFIKDKDQDLPQDPSLLSEENACLTEQLVSITKELDHQNNLLQSRDQTITTLNVKLSKLTEHHNKLQSQIQQLHQDKSFCEEQLVKNISIAQRNEASLQKLEIELDGMRTRYYELEERSKDIMCEKEELQIEAEQLSAKLSAVVASVCETNYRLAVKTSEVDMLNEKVRMLNKDISATQVESMHRETTIACLKSQIEAVQVREAEVSHLHELTRKQVLDVELELDQQKTINNLLKDQVHRLQTEQKSINQKKWKECVTALEDMKQRHQEELHPYKAENHRLHSENSGTRFELDRVAFEKDSLAEKYNQAWRTLTEQKEYCKSHFKEISQRIAASEERYELERTRRFSLEQQLKHTCNELAECKEKEVLQQRQFLERQKAIENDLVLQTDKNQELQYLAKQSVEKSETLSAALDDVKKELKLQNEVLTREHDISIDALKQELYEASEQAKKKISHLQDECRQKQSCTDTLQNEMKAVMECYESKMRDEREANQRLRKDNEDFLARINVLAAENSSCKLLLGDAKDKIDLLEVELDHTKYQLASIGRQLSRRIQNHQEHIMKSTSKNT